MAVSELLARFRVGVSTSVRFGLSSAFLRSASCRWSPPAPEPAEPIAQLLGTPTDDLRNVLLTTSTIDEQYCTRREYGEMVHRREFSVYIAEAVDQQSLDRLRSTLGLTRSGRLTDDWDYNFGERALKGSGIETTWLTLWRADEAPWYLAVSQPEDEPPSEPELAAWRREVIEGIHKAGLTLHQRSR
ncbi:hypothetical protein [Nocardia sp. CA-119907]|uniref:hypothetical protein n=1 Tax=Nocardia sp. CA-119907 TaxID=3239973 RepID=UPI003D96B1A5